MVDLMNLFAQSVQTQNQGIGAPFERDARQAQTNYFNQQSGMVRDERATQQERQRFLQGIQALPPQQRIAAMINSGDPTLVNAASNFLNSIRVDRPQETGLQSALGKEIRDLAIMADQGMITPEEFDVRKTMLINQVKSGSGGGSAGGSKKYALDRKIDIIQETYGISREEAAAVALGDAEFKQDDVTKKVDFVNNVTGETKTINEGMTTEELLPPELPEDSDVPTIISRAENVAGIVPTIKQVAGEYLGEFFPSVVNPKIAKDRQFVMNTNQKLVKSLQQSPRFAEGERKQIAAREATIDVKTIDNPKLFRARAQAVDDFLQQEERLALQDINNASLSTSMRQAALNDYKEMRNYRNILGVKKNPSEQQIPEDINDLLNRFAPL